MTITAPGGHAAPGPVTIWPDMTPLQEAVWQYGQYRAAGHDSRTAAIMTAYATGRDCAAELRRLRGDDDRLVSQDLAAVQLVAAFWRGSDPGGLVARTLSALGVSR